MRGLPRAEPGGPLALGGNAAITIVYWNYHITLNPLQLSNLTVTLPDPLMKPVADGCPDQVHTYFSLGRTAKLLGLFYFGLLPFFPLHESLLEVPMLARADQARLANSSWVTGGWKLCLLQMAGWLLRSRLLIWHLQRRGIATIVWSYDNDEDFADAFALGVDGVMTDSPAKLRRFLERCVTRDSNSKYHPSYFVCAGVLTLSSGGHRTGRLPDAARQGYGTGGGGGGASLAATQPPTRARESTEILTRPHL